MPSQLIAGEVVDVNGKFLTFKTNEGQEIELSIEEIMLKLIAFKGKPEELVQAGTIKLGIYFGTRGAYCINYAQFA